MANVERLGDAADDMKHGRPIDYAAIVYLLGAVGAWLDAPNAKPGDLEKKYLKLRERGNHNTPQRIRRRQLAARKRK